MGKLGVDCMMTPKLLEEKPINIGSGSRIMSTRIMFKLWMRAKVLLSRVCGKLDAHPMPADFEHHALLQSPSKIQRLLEIFIQATKVGSCLSIFISEPLLMRRQ